MRLPSRLRFFSREPGFAALAIGTLALGIAAVTSIFGIIETVLLRPLPYNDPESLYVVWETEPDNPEANVAGANFLDWEAENDVFESLAAFSPTVVTRTAAERAERLAGVEVTPNFFDALGVGMTIGRAFSTDESDARAVIASFEYWRRSLGADPRVVGQSLVLNGESYEIIGVAPEGFEISFENADVWLRALHRVPRPPIDLGVAPEELRGLHWLRVLGRLRDDVSETDARAAMDLVASRLEQAFPDDNGRRGIHLVPLREQIVGEVRRPLAILLGAVGLVLLIVCANVASLFLARAIRQEKDVAVRCALGASRASIVLERLTEAAAVAISGGALGVLLSLALTKGVLALAPRNVFRLEEASINPTVLGFALLASLASGLFFGWLAAIQSSRPNLQSGLKSGGRSATGVRTKLRSGLVVAEVALAMVLLVSAGLLVRSFLLLCDVAPGFAPEHVLTLRVWLPDTRYGDNEAIKNAYRAMLERVSGVPGVETASAVLGVPLSGTSANFGVMIEGREPPAPGEAPEAGLQPVAPGYFRAMGIPLLAGRDIELSDDKETPSVAVIGAAAAERFFPGENPIGKRLSTDGEDWVTIVGIAGDVLHQGLDRAPRSEVYVSFQEMVVPFMTLVLRTRGEPTKAALAAEQALNEVAPDVPVYRVMPMTDVVAQSIQTPRFHTFLLGVFAGAAVFLAAIGLYGLLAYNVGLRRREMGIRLALGATISEVARLVVGEGVRLAALGLAIGVVASFAVSRLLATFLYEVGTSDPVTYASVAALLLGVAVAATLLPARRAGRVEPVSVLRQE